MSNVKSYVPEAFFLEGKDTSHARICREDCALVDPANGFRVVAGRGKEIALGEPYLPLCSLPSAERSFFQSTFAEHSHLLLDAGGSALLLFRDLLPASGLLLAVRLSHGAGEVRNALLLLRRADFVCSPAVCEASGKQIRAEESLCRLLSELFYYLDPILSPTESVGLWTRTALIAGFAGCSAEYGELPVETGALIPAEVLRLSAFLLCLFLTARAESERTLASGELGAVTLLMSVSISPTEEATDSACAYPFLGLPAFREIRLSRSNEGWTLLASFHRERAGVLLSSPTAVALQLRMIFRFKG